MKRKAIILFILLYALCSVTFSGCTAKKTVSDEDANIGNQQTVSETAKPSQSSKYGGSLAHFTEEDRKHYLEITQAESKEKAMELIQKYLEESGRSYEWKTRDYIYVDGQKEEALWLNALNDLGEWIDVVIMDVPTKDLAEKIGISQVLQYEGMCFLRKNEASSYLHKIHFPHEYIGLGSNAGFENADKTWSIYLMGQVFALCDIDPRLGESYYWDGEWTQYPVCERPAPTVQPSTTPVPTEDYRVYTPSSTIDEEINKIQKNLESTERGYTWTIQDHIEIEGNSYPVIWMFAIDTEGEWVDIVFSEDSDFCYYLNQHREVFWNMRSREREEMNAKHPGRDKACEEGIRDEWIVQDVFWNGYSYYMQGHGMAILDCGIPWSAKEWSDEKQGFILWYSRDLHE